MRCVMGVYLTQPFTHARPLVSINGLSNSYQHLCISDDHQPRPYSSGALDWWPLNLLSGVQMLVFCLSHSFCCARLVIDLGPHQKSSQELCYTPHDQHLVFSQDSGPKSSWRDACDPFGTMPAHFVRGCAAAGRPDWLRHQSPPDL